MTITKPERLINLTMALLASKKFISREEIFRKIPGYEGTLESMERMFERDKDDLRSLGIKIDVGSNDPLFEDELGYRILPEKYYLELPEFTENEITVLNLAANLFEPSQLFHDLGGVATKLEALGVNFKSITSLNIESRSEITLKRVQIVVQAAIGKKAISFHYLNQDEARVVFPLHCFFQFGAWYFDAWDQSQVKTFKVDRISSEIEIKNKRLNEEINTPIDRVSYSCQVVVKESSGWELKRKAIKIEEFNSQEKLTLTFASIEEALKSLLWVADSIVEICDPELRKRFLEICQKVSDVSKIN
jgi:proteasome accessory factor B